MKALSKKVIRQRLEDAIYQALNNFTTKPSKKIKKLVSETSRQLGAETSREYKKLIKKEAQKNKAAEKAVKSKKTGNLR